MPRRPTKPLLPVPTWTCPHGGFAHRLADIMRLNSCEMKCKNCGGAFPAKPNPEPKE